jgi:hypothetical protein
MSLKLLDIDYLRAANTFSGQVIVAGSSQNITATSSLVVVNGRVGIGTVSPTQPLTVYGNVGISGSNSCLIFSDGTIQSTSATNAVPPGGPYYSIQFNNTGAFGGNGNLFWDDTLYRLGIGTTQAYSTLQFRDVGMESTNTNVSDITPTVLDSFSVSHYRSCHYIVQISDMNNSWFQTSQVMVVHDGLNAYRSEYNIVDTATRLGDFDVQIVSGNVELIFTAFYTSLKNLKVVRTSLQP